MANKVKIDIIKEYNMLTVFFDNITKVDEEPQTTDSSDIESMINSVKVATWDFQVLSINVDTMRIFIFKDTFPSDTQEFEEIDYNTLSGVQQTIVNDFINSL